MTTSPFTENADFRSLTNADDNFETGGGDDVVFARNGNDVISGEVGNDLLFGGNGRDSLDGGEGNDTLVGGTGADRLTGGNGIDVASYESVTLSVSAFAWRSTHWEVTAVGTIPGDEPSDPAITVNEGKDTLTGVEIVIDADGNRFLLVGHDGFSTIQAAVDAAQDGDTILIGRGTFSGDVNIAGKAITLVGQGKSGGAASTITGTVTVTGTVDGEVRFENLAVNATGKQYGVRVNAAATDGSGVSFENVAIANASVNGVLYTHPSNDSQTNVAPIGELFDAFRFVNVDFSNNGFATSGAGGRGHVNLFGFNGDLTVTGSTFATGNGASPSTPASAQKAFTVVGSGRPDTNPGRAELGTDPDAADVLSPLSSLTFTGNSFTGTYTQDLVSFYYFTSIGSPTLSGNMANVAAPWGLLNLDAIGGTVNVSGFFATATNTGTPAYVAVLQGLAGGGSLVGTSGADLIDGRAGTDTISADKGDDIIRIVSGDHHTAQEVIDGGNGTDSIFFTPATDGSTLTLSEGVTGVETVAIVSAHPTYGTSTVDANIDASAVVGITSIAGSDGDNELTGGAGDQTINGAAGDDLLAGGAGSDVLIGGAGTDTARFEGTVDLNTITSDDGAWVVPAGDEGSDRISGVEVLDGAGGELVLLVGNGGFATIQAALDYAEAHSVGGQSLTVLVAGGTQAGAFTVGSGILAESVTIRAVGEVVIDGTFHEVNGIAEGTTTNEFLRSETSYTTNGVGSGATIGRGNVTLEGLTLADFNYGVSFAGGTHSGVVLRDLTLSQNIVGVHVGTTGVTVNGLSIEGGTIQDGYHGIAQYRGSSDGSVFNNLSVDGTTFERLGEKGIYLEGLNGGSFTDLVMTDVGQWGRGPRFDYARPENWGGFGSGIDINLKYGDFTGAITISDFNFTDVGTSNKSGGASSHFGGAAITFKARNDGPSYGSSPASYTGTITIRDGEVDGTSTFFRLGEPGKSPTTGTPVTGAGAVVNISNVSVTDYVTDDLHGLVDNRTTLGLVNATFSGTSTIAPQSFGPVLLQGGAGNDNLTGGDGSSVGGVAYSGAETLDGGAGDDVMAGGAGNDVYVVDSGADQVVEVAGEGADTVRASVSHTLADEVEDLVLTGGGDIAGTGNTLDNVITGNAGANLLDGAGGDDTMHGGAGGDTYLVDADDVVVEAADGGTDTVVSSRTGNTTLANNVENLTLTDAGAASGTGNALGNVITGGDGDNLLSGLAGNDTLLGGEGADTLDGGTGDDEMEGGEGSDLFLVDDAGDTATDSGAAGTDEVRASVSHTLGAGVENLTLVDGASRLEDFENFETGPIANGENGWKYAGTSDQTVVEIGGNKMFRMSSDPGSGSFGGPYTPALAATAGEPGTTADFNSMAVTFTFKAVNPTADNSRLEVDFGNDAGTDRNNFMVIESIAGSGIRIAVNEPNSPSDWTNNTFTAFTGNRELASGLDAADSYQLTMVLRFLDGADNDVIDLYLDGTYIGTTSTFENFRSGDHDTAAEANQVSRLFFRNSAGGAPTDGPGGVNQGFLFDDIAYSVFNADGPDGTGNELANVITGNSGANALDGAGGDDVLSGGIGHDTLTGGAGNDELVGGVGNDVATYEADLTLDSFVANGSGYVVSADAEGTDSLSGVEIVEDGEGERFLFVGEGHFATIQAAVDAANAGDTIVVAAGTYAGALNINKAVTIVGPNRGNDGASGDRVGEAVITGFTQVTAASGEVTLSGLQFLYTGAKDSLTITMNSGGMLTLIGGADVTIADSRFIAQNPQGGDAASGRAIMLPTNFTGSVTIADNYFGGAATNAFGGANWNRAVWSDGNSAELTVTGNTFHYVRTGLNLDGYDSATTSVSGNLFNNTGSGISVGANSDTTFGGLTGNTFANVGSDFNLQNMASPLTFDAGTNQATAGGSTVPGADFLAVLGGSGNDALTGNAGKDALTGNGGNDSLDGEAGDDVLSGGAGDDVLTGGDGNDTLTGGANNDTAVLPGDATLIGNFDGSVTVLSASGTDLLVGVEFVVVGEAAPAAVPAAPVLTVELVEDTGEDDDSATTNDAAVQGTGRPSTDVTITWTVGAYSVETTATVGTDGTWTAVAPLDLPEGPVTVAVEQNDGVGGSRGAEVEFVFDTTAPATPTVDLSADDDTGASTSDDVTKDTSLTISVSADDGSIVKLYVAGTQVDEGVASGGVATFSGVTFDPSPGTDWLITATATDAAGNVSTAGELTVRIDTETAEPTIDLDAGSDIGESSTDNLTALDTVSLSGQVEPGSTVVLSLGAETFAGTVDEDGHWTATVTGLAAGDNLITVQATDLAGNTSENDLTVTRDVTAPTVVISRSGSGTVNGNSTSETITFTFSEMVYEFSADDVTISGGGTLTNFVQQTFDSWSATYTPAADFEGYVTIEVAGAYRDFAGNTGTAAELEFAVDTTPPPAPVLLTTTLTSAGGATLVATGTAAAFAQVALYASGLAEPIGSTTADGSGNWSVTVATPLSANSYALTARAMDEAGNQGAASNGIDLVVGAVGGRLAGGTGAETLGGATGSDTLVASAGEGDSLAGGAGFDVADYRAFDGIVALLDAGTVEAGGKTDSVSGIEGVIGGDGGDLIFGDAEGNLLWGGAGDDVLDGAFGNDTLLGGAGADELAGGDGVDVVSYAGDTAGVSVNLATGSASGGDAAGDVLFGIEGLIGGAGNDSLVGDGTANALEGGAGADSLDGGAAADTLLGGEGADTLRGEAGGDLVSGGDGFDVVSYAGSSAVLIHLGNATVLGSGGHSAGDTLIGIEGIVGGNGSDNLTGSSADNLLAGENGNDTLTGGLGADTLTGGIGNDRLLGEDGNDLLDGGAGADTIDGGDGVDTAGYGFATAGVNLSLAVAGVQATGGGGSDVLVSIENLIGSAFADTLAGSAGDNVLSGGEGNDTLSGGNGNDTLEGGAGADTLNGGLGIDTVTYAGATGGVTVGLQLGTDQDVGGGMGIDRLLNFENLVGSAFGDNLRGNNVGNVIEGGAGADTLFGANGDDTLVGGAGADSLNGGAGLDVFRFGEGDSTTASRDQISDFQVGSDIMDLAAVDAVAGGADNAFAFVAEGGAFSAAGQLRVVADGAGFWLVQGNTDSDLATVEFEVRVASAVTLEASSFVL